MIKRFICFILCLTMILPLSAFAEQSVEPDVYFSADFNDDELPPGSDVTFGDDGYIFAEDGKLRLETTDTYPPVSAVLFPYEVRVDSYMYECDITVESALSGNCWFSLCFGAVNDNILYQFTVKYGITEEDSVSLQYKNGASSWKKISTASLPDFIGEGKIDKNKFKNGMIKPGAEFKVAVAVRDGMAFGFIDGTAVTEGGLPSKRFGRIGLNGRGVTVSADNVSVSSGIPSWAFAADSFSANIYTPDTGLIEAPTVIQRDRLSLTSYSENRQRPAAVMMTVKESGGKLHGYDGAVDLGELETRIKAFYGLAVPAFYVADELSSAMLSAFIEENGYNDCFVIVSKLSLLEIFSNNKYLRTVVDMSSRSSVSVAEISRLLYSNGCRTVMLSETAADSETVYELHKRLITVWVSGTAGVDSLFDSAVNGADAVVASDASALISVFEKIDDTVMMRRRVIIYDEALDRSDNTLRNVISALDKGISAVRISASLDNKGAASAGADTLLEEIFESVYKEYPQSVFHIDVENNTVFPGIVELIGEYEMTDRCVILSSDASVLRSAAAEGMASAYTGGPYTADGREPNMSLSSLCRVLNGYNSAYYAGAEGMPEELIHLMNDRGMFVCLANGGNAVQVISGSSGYTVTDPLRIAKQAVMLNASADESGRLIAKVRYYDGTELDVTALCDIVTLSGDVKLSGGTVKGNGVFSVICPQTSDSGEKYSVCSKIIKIYDDISEPDTEQIPDNSDNKTLTAVIIAVSAAAAAAGVIILLYLTGKKRRNDKKQAE